MSDAATLRDLIARVESAAGHDRELDRAIARLLLPAGAEDVAKSAHGWSYRVFGPNGWDDEWLETRPYTDSLDAALTLVPKGKWWIAGYGKRCPKEPLGGAAIYYSTGLATGTLVAEAEAATPALALCAAALRARLAEMEARDE